MTAIPNFAPGCFGSALAYQDTHPVCSSCKFAAECKPVHETNLEILKRECHIQPKRKSFTIADTTAAPAAGGATVLTTKVKAYIEKIERDGIKITESFAKGVNPFQPGSLNFMLIASHLLLKLQKPLTNDQLAVALQTRLKLGRSTADAYARMASQILRHVGAVEWMDGAMTLRRS